MTANRVPPRHLIGAIASECQNVLAVGVTGKGWNHAQALDRTPQGVPIKLGSAGSIIYGCVVQGTTTPFAPLNVLHGATIGRWTKRQRLHKPARLPDSGDVTLLVGKVIHASLNNRAANKHPKLPARLARHPHSTFNLGPTSGSRLNTVAMFVPAIISPMRTCGISRSRDARPVRARVPKP